MITSWEIPPGWMPQNPFHDNSTLVQVMAWWQQAIAQANDDQDICHYMASPGHNELKVRLLPIENKTPLINTIEINFPRKNAFYNTNIYKIDPECKWVIDFPANYSDYASKNTKASIILAYQKAKSIPLCLLGIVATGFLNHYSMKNQYLGSEQHCPKHSSQQQSLNMCGF